LLNEHSNKRTRVRFEKNITPSRTIFHTDDVDKLYHQLKYDKYIGKSITFGNQPTDAPVGERFFHFRDPDDYQLSFAQPISYDKFQESRQLPSMRFLHTLSLLERRRDGTYI
jgi:hypothetical protein